MDDHLHPKGDLSIRGRAQRHKFKTSPFSTGNEEEGLSMEEKALNI